MNTTPSQETLLPKPCPFCGCDVQTWGQGKFVRHPIGKCWLSEENRLTLKQWNTRATPPTDLTQKGEGE